MSQFVLRACLTFGTSLQRLLFALTTPVRHRLGPPANRGTRTLRARLQALRQRLPARVHRPVYFVLVVLFGVLLMLRRQIDRALSQMHLPGESGGGALGFPLRPGTTEAVTAVREQREAWQHYLTAVPDTRVVAAPQTLVHQLVLLDLLFIAVYGLLLGMLLLRLTLVNATLPDRFVEARRRWLVAAGFGLALLVVVDLAENALVWLTLGAPGLTAAAAAGPVASLLRLLVAVAIGVPVVITAAAYIAGRADVRRALISARVVLIELVLVAAVLLVFGMGKEQTDDVVRAWGLGQGLMALAAGIAAALVVTGVVTHLTGEARDHPDPDSGEDPQPLVLGAGVACTLAGLLLHLLGAGWGLVVPGVMLILLWAIGLPLSATGRVRPAALPHPRTTSQHATADQPAPAADQPQPTAGQPTAGGDLAVVTTGRSLAVVMGAALLAVLIWVIARASAFDLFVRSGPPRWGWVLLVTAVGVVLLVAGSVLASLPGVTGRTGWTPLTLAALGLAVASMLPQLQVTLPAHGGSVAVMLTFVVLLVGTTGWLTARARRGRVTRFRLVPAVRAVGYQRFPVVVFVVAWFVAVSVIDQGGYHDIRRVAGPGVAPPTLEQAFRTWQQADPGARARPLVIVAAQGGGIRAAVWTALVMECLFGPGPVRADADCAGGNSESLDRASARAAMDAAPLPVFLASAASGGSVGLAAWSARRVDLAAGGRTAEATPATVEDALGRDFLAANLARWFTGDLSYPFLGHRLPDRASVLEWAWEQPWGEDGTGLSRGLRASYQQANPAGDWRIPVLAFNGAGVEDGCRFLSSPVDFEITRPDRQPPLGPGGALDTPTDAGCRAATQPADGELAGVLPVTGELVDYLCADQDVPMSTAAHLSARFPYISPTGRVERQGCADPAGLVEERAVTFDADGGLFDNSGALTALESWRALAPLAAQGESDQGGCIVPIFVQIDNGVGNGAGTGPDRKPSELAAPLNALFGEIGSRESYGRASAATAFTRPVSPGGREVTLDGQPPQRLWFQLALFGQPGPRPPLGWTLADTTVDDIRAQLGAGPNQEQIRQLRSLLSGNLTCG